MKGLFQHIFDYLNSNTVRSLSIGMLVILCLLSSCSIRKSVASLFSDQSSSYLVFNKGTKSSAVNKSGLDYNSVECKLTGQALDDTQLSIKQAVSSPLAMLPFLFLVLPEFLVSLLIGIKTPTILPVPNSWLRWAYLPLFLQNRLLLI
ncbi:hypothetical protein [Pedobacter immunditicola]|uniref:hypothetical protein n=1 Tax=Pedobacter immunditicola TaxID=3133440 RepID=UPI0030B6C534